MDQYLQEMLDTLRWHWGSAYVIDCFDVERWVAQRRDDRATLTASTPEELLRRIGDDYTRRPVPRDVC